MYNTEEKPLVKASLFYYDNDYLNEWYPNAVFCVLEKYGLTMPAKYYAGKLTNNRFVLFDRSFKDIFTKAYIERNVFQFSMRSNDLRKSEDVWLFDWNYTFYKGKVFNRNTSFKPWNIISIAETHYRLRNENIRNSFIMCFKELLATVQPFYGNVDDVDNKVNLLQGAGLSCFRPSDTQPIYWGNYLGKEYCNSTGYENLLSLPCAQVERIGDGVYFSLTSSVLEYNSLECRINREIIQKRLTH